MTREQLRQRLMRRTVIQADGCWFCAWGGKGTLYGTVSYNGKPLSNHVASYIAHGGTLYETLVIMHTCDNKRCINPKHLFQGTQGNNMKDAYRKRLTRIPQTKLSETQVLLIRALPSAVSRREIGKRFGISEATVSQIINRKTWTHL